MMRVGLVMVIAFLPLGGCLGDRHADGPDGTEADAALVFPADYEIDGAELMQHDDSNLTFRWRPASPVGAYVGMAGTGTEEILEFTLPDALPVGILVLPHADPAYPVGSVAVELSNGAGFVCRGGQLAPCTALAPSDGPRDWRVVLRAGINPVPPAQYEVELQLQTTTRVDELLAVPSCEDVCWFPSSHETYEPTIGITPQGTLFSVALNPQVANPTFVARSLDGGLSWDLLGPGVAGQSLHLQTVDPYLHVDPVTGRVFMDDLHGKCSLISWSDDEGETWDHTMGGCAEVDRQTLFTGPPVLSVPVGYARVVYRCAINAGATGTTSLASTCSKSLDGGVTWVSTGAPAFAADPTMMGNEGVPGVCGGGHGHGFVDHRGWVYLPKGHCGQPMLAISKDEGLTWTRVQVSDLGMPFGFARDGEYNGRYEYNADVGVDATGRIIYTWVARDRLPYAVESNDGGATWSEPVRLGPADIIEATLGALAVDAAGRFVYAFVGSRNSPGEPWTDAYDAVTWDAFVVTGTAITDSNSTQVNPVGDPIVRGDCGIIRCQIGDFIDVQIDGNSTAWAVFGDACIEACPLFEDARAWDVGIGRLAVVRIPLAET